MKNDLTFINSLEMKLALKFLLIFFICIKSYSQENSFPSASSILKKIDFNMLSKTQIITSEMIVYGKRKSRTIRSKGYSEGLDKNFTEYLYPEREKGTKMLQGAFPFTEDGKKKAKQYLKKINNNKNFEIEVR